MPWAALPRGGALSTVLYVLIAITSFGRANLCDQHEVLRMYNPHWLGGWWGTWLQLQAAFHMPRWRAGAAGWAFGRGASLVGTNVSYIIRLDLAWHGGHPYLFVLIIGILKHSAPQKQERPSTAPLLNV
jgi:hypothetical protein